jgi:hypothetical protein
MKLNIRNQTDYSQLIEMRQTMRHHTQVRERINEIIKAQNYNCIFIVENDKVLKDLARLSYFDADEAYQINNCIRLANEFNDFIIVSKDTYKSILNKNSEEDFTLMIEKELEYFYYINAKIIIFELKVTKEDEVKHTYEPSFIRKEDGQE